MTLKEMPMYFYECDNCDVTSTEDSEYSAWSDSSDAWDEATNDGWAEIDGKHYCSACKAQAVTYPSSKALHAMSQAERNIAVDNLCAAGLDDGPEWDRVYKVIEKLGDV